MPVEASSHTLYVPSPVNSSAITMNSVELVPPGETVGYDGKKLVLGFGGRTERGAASSIIPPANPFRLVKVIVEIASVP